MLELIEIAQLVTGIATLIVASVLIWQMIIQKRTLDIAHNDADANMSLYAMDTRSRTNEWFADQCTPEFLDKFDKGLDSLTKKEFSILEAYIRDTIRVLTTEARLGRLTDNDMLYYRSYFTRMELNLDNKLFRDYIEKYYLNVIIGNSMDKFRRSNFVNVVKESWEKASGKKFELKK
tara:strand:- start:400 stop:930 length:531 start_codon:yes stop_codon:yes gene_type:complete